MRRNPGTTVLGCGEISFIWNRIPVKCLCSLNTLVAGTPVQTENPNFLVPLQKDYGDGGEQSLPSP